MNQVAAPHWPSLVPPQARWRSPTSTSSCTTRRGGAAMARRGSRDVFSTQPVIIHHQARRGRSAHRPYRGPRQCRCGAAAGGSSGKQLARPARSGAAHRTTHGAEPTLDSRLWRYGTRRSSPPPNSPPPPARTRATSPRRLRTATSPPRSGARRRAGQLVRRLAPPPTSSPMGHLSPHLSPHLPPLPPSSLSAQVGAATDYQPMGQSLPALEPGVGTAASEPSRNLLGTFS